LNRIITFTAQNKFGLKNTLYNISVLLIIVVVTTIGSGVNIISHCCDLCIHQEIPSERSCCNSNTNKQEITTCSCCQSSDEVGSFNHSITEHNKCNNKFYQIPIVNHSSVKNILVQIQFISIINIDCLHTILFTSESYQYPIDEIKKPPSGIDILISNCTLII